MFYKWMWVAAILGIARALPTKSHLDADQLIKIFKSEDLGRNSAIENIIINALEDFRQTMLTGTDDIPVLDPFHLDYLFVDDAIIPFPGAQVELKDLVLSKLSTFEMKEVSVNSISIILQRYSLQIEGEVPVVDVDIGGYDFLLNFWGLDLFGKGDAKISVVKSWLKIDAIINIRLGLGALYLNIMEMRLDFGLSDIQFGITGMFNDPWVDDFVNRFLRNLILELVEFWADDLSDIISPIVTDVANDILSDINLIDFLT